jgi:hypothetical protein
MCLLENESVNVMTCVYSYLPYRSLAQRCPRIEGRAITKILDHRPGRIRCRRTYVLCLGLFIDVLARAFWMPTAGLALEPAFPAAVQGGVREAQGPDLSERLRGQALEVADAQAPNPTLESAPTPHPSEVPASALSWEMRPGRSYVIPALEIPTYQFLLNLYDRHFIDPKEDYRTTGNTIRTHLTDSKWVLDNDQFSVNQFLHPYGGTVYYGLARSAGLNFWESFLYAGAGSFLWEIGGEKTMPSINDQITTTFGGTFLGEPLFRMANLLLESDDEGKPGFWRELGAAVISPPTGFNRLVFGNRFDEVYPSHNPATFMRFQVGGTLTSSSHNVSTSVKEQGAVADVSLIYGLPGKPGYTYTRPFDYFDFHLSGGTAKTIETLETRGLLVGTSYASGDSTRGIWGLYGSYDYIVPQVFRVSTTALSLGTTWQTWLSDEVALQGTALGGTGYGAAGSIQRTGERDYHYGVAPQGLLSLRLILGNRAMLDFTGREYYVTGLLSNEPHGMENILRADGSFTVRIFDRHGIAIRYVASHRDATYPNVEFKNQTVGTVSLMYVLLGNTGFGAVEWR